MLHYINDIVTDPARQQLLKNISASEKQWLHGADLTPFNITIYLGVFCLQRDHQDSVTVSDTIYLLPVITDVISSFV